VNFGSNARIFALALVGFLPVAAIAGAAQAHPGNRAEQERKQQAQRQQAQQHHVGEWLRKYKDMPPDQQQKALANDPQFKNLPPQAQNQLRQRLQQFNNLTPEQRQRTLDRMEKWEHLTPEQKQEAKGVFSRFQQLPADRKLAVRRGVQELSQMPADQREQALQSDRFKNNYSPDEIDLLRGASKLPIGQGEGPGAAAEPGPPEE
jgi:type II secretory pathway pseudopilin PulG